MQRSRRRVARTLLVLTVPVLLSRGTAKIHVSNILAKLGIANRSELAAEAARRGISASKS